MVTGDRVRPKRVLVTGATGYVGGRLVPLLEAAGLSVRCLARRPEALRSRVSPATEVVRGDVFDAASLERALLGVDVAYYLVHSMGSGGDYREQDRRAARAFSEAAERAGVARIVYLGGLAHPEGDLSKHLRSRLETGEVLRSGRVPVVEFRASVIIGSGSLSFELIRSLVERLPIMICPRWVGTLAQPIGIDDLLAYLMAAADWPGQGHAVFEVGGADQASYGDVMREYARQRGLTRRLVSIPLLTPRLSSLWLGLVTPVYARIGRELVEGVRNASVVTDTAALRAFPIRPAGLAESIRRAIRFEDRAFAQTRWSDSRSSGGQPPSFEQVTFGTRRVDARRRFVAAEPHAAFAPIARIGGETGWYYADRLWQLRGAIDLLLGGVGMRRGRRDPERPIVGDTIDFWRVEAYEPDRRLRLAAEMKLPGRAWLEFEVIPHGTGSYICQTAIFDPVGLWGLLYWYALVPVHTIMFERMLQAIAHRSETLRRAA